MIIIKTKLIQLKYGFEFDMFTQIIFDHLRIEQDIITRFDCLKLLFSILSFQLKLGKERIENNNFKLNKTRKG
uniref:Uncharacterized protein n=1 Tax=Pithovirus LCPAC201 TaxID=2506591 RepID=A0A481Z4E6_9VIRU|nr:MAG: hypothetical protein LCPAC201_00740 [Pithovirus LCPAC201]